MDGHNWVGRRARASTDREELLSFRHTPGAHMLLQLARVSHPTPDKVFALDQTKVAEILGWSRNTLRDRIQDLIDAGFLELVRKGTGPGRPSLYRIKVR